MSMLRALGISKILILACVASVSVRFRSKERGTKVKMAQAKERPKPRIPFLGLSFLRTQTETIATQATMLFSGSSSTCCQKLRIFKWIVGFKDVRFERQHWKPFCSIQENIYKIGNVIFIFYDKSDPRRDPHERRKALGPGAKVHAHVNRDINSCSWFALCSWWWCRSWFNSWFAPETFLWNPGSSPTGTALVNMDDTNVFVGL